MDVDHGRLSTSKESCLHPISFLINCLMQLRHLNQDCPTQRWLDCNRLLDSGWCLTPRWTVIDHCLTENDQSLFFIYNTLHNMSALFHGNDLGWLLHRLNSFPHHRSNMTAYYAHIHYEVDSFVRSKMPHAPSPTMRTCYFGVLYYLSSIQQSPVTYHFIHWDTLAYPPVPNPESCPYGVANHFHPNSSFHNPYTPLNARIQPHHSTETSASNNNNHLPDIAQSQPARDVVLPLPTTDVVPSHSLANEAQTNETHSFATREGPPAIISLNSSYPLPNTPDTSLRSRSVSFVGIPANQAVKHDRQVNHDRPTLSPVLNSHSRQVPRSLLKAMSDDRTPAPNLSDQIESQTHGVAATPTSNHSYQIETQTQGVALPISINNPAVPPVHTVPLCPTDKGTRYDFVFGYASPPEFSTKAIVRDHLALIFPCPNGGWLRKRGERTNIIFACKCPTPTIIRLTLHVVPGLASNINYSVPIGQGIPHNEEPLHLPTDSIAPWEIDIIKGIVKGHTNMQPMVAYGLWTKLCTNHVDSVSRCPDPVPGVPYQVVTKRTLYSTGITFLQFLGFYKYYRKYTRGNKRELVAPPTSVAFLWAYQTEHSFWDHLRMITNKHQFVPMPTESFTSIDHLGEYLHIVPSMIFTIPVESTDLDQMDLPADQKMKAFGSLFCFGLPHLWTLCLFLRENIQHRALLSDFTRFSKMGFHLNEVGPCSHQINWKQKTVITRRKHSLGHQVCPGENGPAVVLYHKSLQKITPRIFSGSQFTASVDSSDQSRAVFKGTIEAHPGILKVPDKVHITRHCVEDVTWRSKMKDKKKFPGRVYNKVKMISLMYGHNLTTKAWELSFKEWNQEGEGVFSDFMQQRNQGPESKYGGGRLNYTASQIMGVRNDNQPSEAWFRLLKGSEASQTPPVVHLSVNFENFLNTELERLFQYDTLHVSRLPSLRSAHGTMIPRDRSIPTLVLAACALLDTNIDQIVRTHDQLKTLCENYNQSGCEKVYIVNGLPRMGKSIQDEDVKEWLRVVYNPNPHVDDYVEYYHQILIGLSLVNPTLDKEEDTITDHPIMVQHQNLPYTCTCREFWDSAICHCSLSVADNVTGLSPVGLNDMFHMVYSNNPGHLKRPGPKRKTHTRQRYKTEPTRFHRHFGLPLDFLDPRFLFLANLTFKQILDLARSRKSNFHGQTQNTLSGNSLMELILEGTRLADTLLECCGMAGTVPSFENANEIGGQVCGHH